MKTRQNGCDVPSAILCRKGIARYGGGITHWAAEGGLLESRCKVMKIIPTRVAQETKKKAFPRFSISGLRRGSTDLWA